MKKWILVFPVIIILSIAGFFYFNKSTPPPSDNVLSAIEDPTTSPTPAPRIWPQSTLIDIDEVPIRISWAIVDPKDVDLYSNLSDQKLSEEIKVSNSCKVLVSGGFFTKENNHLGLFIADFKIISNSIGSDLFNGYLWIDADSKALIDADKPGTTPRIGLQSGPLLMKNGRALPLAINNDEPDRRIAAGITADNKLIFMVFYRDSAEYAGPMLGKLPEIIGLLSKKTKLNIVEAINLDGGSHSVFISNYDLLRELNIIGSYFCTK